MHQISVVRLLVGMAAALSATLPTVGTALGATADPDRTDRIAGREIAVWLPPETGRPHPLVLFSHGFGGCSAQSAFLMRTLAEAGMLVAAPDHADKGVGCPQSPPVPNGLGLDRLMNPANWNPAFYQDRRDDLEQLWAALQTDADYAGLIDQSRVALVGHSLGGYTVLALAGAWPTWKTDGIAAVVALAPFAQPFRPGAVPLDIDVPVLFQAGSEDRQTPASLVRATYTATPGPACVVVYKGARHLAWTDLDREYRDAMGAAIVAFLDEVFAGRQPTATNLVSAQTDGGEECK
jgi:predicted dienelactone hydrolase